MQIGFSYVNQHQLRLFKALVGILHRKLIAKIHINSLVVCCEAQLEAREYMQLKQSNKNLNLNAKMQNPIELNVEVVTGTSGQNCFSGQKSCSAF